MYSDSDSDGSEWRPRLHADLDERKAYRESKEDHIKQLIGKGEPLPPSILWAAVHWYRPESVDLLLSAGADPNWRHARAEEVMPQAEHDWLDRDPDRLPHTDDGAMPPLRLAALAPCDEEHREKGYRMVSSLLRHGADPYAIFAQQLEEVGYPEEGRPLFPGEEIGQTYDPTVVSSRIIQRIEEALGADFVGTSPEVLNLDFGLCSVVHAVLEYSAFFKPFLESPEFMKDPKLGHRSPQGRTLFLSACRNQYGADMLLDKVRPNQFSVDHDSEYRATFPPGIYSEPSAEGAQPRTAMQALLNLGSDPLVTDNQGKHALHQLLEAHTRYDSDPPVIRQSLRYLIARFPSLVNQPDHNGMAPIHTALRRLWQYTATECWIRINLAPLEDCVLDLIEAGANVHARDAHDNTVLHYLADGHLDAFDGSQRRRQLFYMLLDKYQCTSYINTRNNLDQTPIQLMLTYTSRKEGWHTMDTSRFWSESPDMQPIDEELFGKFDEAGTDWMVRDKFGRTLLHGVAQTNYWGPRAEWRCRYLIQKGINPLACDFEGKTARDLAPHCQFHVLKFLKEAEEAETYNQPR